MKYKIKPMHKYPGIIESHGCSICICNDIYITHEFEEIVSLDFFEEIHIKV